MKKAQVQQVFIYIMAIIVIGAILLLGLRAILGFFDRACEVDEIAFKRDIEDLLNRYSRYGNRGFETLRVPCDYNELCFIDLENRNCNDITNEVIKEECLANTNENVFITRGQFTESLFSIPNIAVANGFTCIEPRSNRYHLRLEGVGQGKVEITPDTP